MTRVSRLTAFLPLLALVACEPRPEIKPLPPLPELTLESASNFAQITLKCVQKEYPNSPGFVLNAAADVQPANAASRFLGEVDQLAAEQRQRRVVYRVPFQ